MLAERLLRIGQTWSGLELPPEEQVCLRLSATPAGLKIDFESPWYVDPLPAAAPGLMDGLWEHEVVEVFVASAAEPSVYTEIELGPAGHHLGLRFDGIRRRGGAPFGFSFEAQRTAGRWRGHAFVEASRLPKRPWRINAFALNGLGQRRRYLLAHRLPGETPDFHQPGDFPAWSALPFVSDEKR